MNKLQTKIQRQILDTAYQTYNKGLNSYAFFKVNDHATGEDLVQDTFIKTWRYLVKEGKINTMKSFLYHVLNNLIIDEYRKRKHSTTSLEKLSESGFEPGVDDSEKMFNILDGKGVVSLIQHLPNMYRKIIKMRFIQDLSIKEISLLTGQSQNTIAVQIHRGLEKLKLLYKHK